MVGFDKADLSLRRLLVYALATMVTVGIFFAHNNLARHAHKLHATGSQHFHVDQRFWNSEKIKDQRISVHGDFTFKELEKQMKALKEEHKAMRKAATERAPSKAEDAAAFDQAAAATMEAEHAAGSFGAAAAERHKGTAKDLEAHRQSNPTFAVKDPFEEKCVTSTLEERLERRFKDSFISNREDHPYRSNFKVPKYWPLHMRGNNICKHIKWQVVGQVNNKVLRILPASDFIKQSLQSHPRKLGTCAVVGNGGGSLLAEHGKHIDSHDLVFRFNGGPTRGFEKHVGSRTSFRVTNSEHFFFHEKHTNETVLQHITNSKNFKQLFKISERASLKDVLPNLKIIDPFFQYYVLNLHNDGAPSNGFYGIALANLLCTQITLFGYQKEWKHQKIPYHYYDKVEPNANQYGRDTREVSRFNDLLDSINAVAARDRKWLEWRDERKWPMGKVVTAEQYMEHVAFEEIRSDGGGQGQRVVEQEEKMAVAATAEEEKEEVTAAAVVEEEDDEDEEETAAAVVEEEVEVEEGTAGDGEGEGDEAGAMEVEMELVSEAGVDPQAQPR